MALYYIAVGIRTPAQKYIGPQEIVSMVVSAICIIESIVVLILHPCVTESLSCVSESEYFVSNIEVFI
jgi:hypothetical protein